jgi:hypothetical protein
MHRTEGKNNDGGLYTEGPPPTTITAAAMNALQEELASVIEYSGQSLLRSDNDTQNQLLAAVMLISLRISQAMKIGEYIYATNETEATQFLADGALEMDGNTCSATDYPYLALAHPTWVAAGVITRPNWSNRVLRVKGTDTGDAGTLQEDQMQGHEHDIDTYASGGLSGHRVYGTAYQTELGTVPTNGQVANATDGTPRTGTETRGKAFIVRAFVIADGYFD